MSRTTATTTTTTKRWTTSLSLLFTCMIALVMIMMSTSSFGPASSSSSSMVQCSQGATPTRHYPQMLDDGLGWAGYGIYIAIVLIIFAIFFFVIYNVAFYIWCCRCSCQVCGGSKPKLGGYSSNQIRLSILSNAGIFVVFSTMMILVMLFCILFTTTLRKVEKDTNGLANTFLDRIDNGIQSINNTDHIVDDVFSKLDTVVDSFSGLNSTIRTIDTSLDGAKQDVTDANSLLNHLQGDFSNMTILIHRIENGSGLEESPQSQDVPDLGEYTTELNNVLASLDSAQSNINSAYTTLNDLIDQVKTQVNDSRSTIQSSFSDVKSAVNEPLNQVTKYTDKGRDIMNQVFYYVNVVDNVRISLFITFLAVIFVIFAFGIVGVCCQWRWSPRLTACCSFFIPFLFIVIGLLHLILFIAFTDVCREVEPAVKRSQSLVDKYILDKSSSTNTASARRLMSTLDTNNMFQISEFNTDAIMGNISDIALDILYCSGNDSILDMIPGLETDFLNVTGLIDPVRQEINNTIQSFNASSLTSEASSFITDFYNQTNDLVTVSFQNATDYLLVIQSHVNEIYPQYDNYTRFGYDESIVEPKLDELNQESAKLEGKYWTLDNVTALDPASSPYVLNQTFFHDRRALLLDYKDVRDEVISKTNSLKQDTLELNSTLNHCLAELNQLKSLIVNDQHIKAIQSAIDSVPSNINDVAQSAMSVVDYAIDKVNDLIDNVTGIAHCNYVGNYYKSSRSNVCEQLGPFSGVITLSCWIISVLLLTWFVVLLPTTKRLGFPKDPEEEIEEMGHVEMDPMDHQMI